MDKKSFRRECLSRINRLSEEERREFSRSICAFISDHPAFLKAGTVFAYSALSGEPDLGTLIADHPEKQWAFPKTSPDNRLSFFLASSMTGMNPGQFGICEPDPALHSPAPYSSADLILVPGLGFDPFSGARLGRGKGYYDRFLGCIPGSRVEEPKSLKVGVCFSAQFATLQAEPHDVPMHLMVSESGWHIPAIQPGGD